MNCREVRNVCGHTFLKEGALKKYTNKTITIYYCLPCSVPVVILISLLDLISL